MARTKVNKSQAIRDYVMANPSASAKQVVEALGKKKIEVSPATVATVKSKAGLTKQRKSGSQKVDGRRRSINGSQEISVDTLIEAKKLCAAAGSMEKAVEALRVISKIDSVS